MFGSAIVDVALGLVFIYFVLSVICSHINEMLAGVYGWRKNDLEKAIRRMLEYDKLGDSTIAHEVLNHPLIHALGDRPSYIPKRTFALALLDVCAPEPGKRGTLKALRDQIMALPEGLRTRKALLAIVDQAEGGVESARKGVEDWFDATMDRLTGTYKRHLMKVNLVVASVVVIVVGVDTVAIATTLWQEQAIRAAVAGTATQASQSGLEDAVNALSQFNLPLGWTWLPTTLYGWLLKGIGIIVTILAVSLGAPFWFDVLKNISNLRASGPKPEEAAPEPARTPAPAPTVVRVPTPMALEPETTWATR